MAYVTNIKTVITYDLDNVTKTFTIPFEYLSRTFVVVTLIGTDRKVLENVTDYTFITSTQITTNVAWGDVTGYDQIEIRRQTSDSERIVDFQNGSVLRADDLNVSQIQSLHLAAEARDLVSDTIGTDNDGNLDARGRKLINLADGTDDGDAVNLRQQKTWAGSALNQADRAKTEADRAQAQATIATNQATISTNNATTAINQATIAVNAAAAAKTSETNARISETNAQAAQNGANDFQNAASGFATSAENSAISAKADADRAQSANPDNQLKKANNLSDLANTETARSNLGLGWLQRFNGNAFMIAPAGVMRLAVDDNGKWGAYNPNTGYIPLGITEGGTGANTPAGVRTNLSLYSISEVQSKFNSLRDLKWQLTNNIMIAGTGGWTTGSTVALSAEITGQWVRFGAHNTAADPNTRLIWSTPVFVPLGFNGNEVITFMIANWAYTFDCITASSARLLSATVGAQGVSYCQIIKMPTV